VQQIVQTRSGVAYSWPAFDLVNGEGWGGGGGLAYIARYGTFVAEVKEEGKDSRAIGKFVGWKDEPCSVVGCLGERD